MAEDEISNKELAIKRFDKWIEIECRQCKAPVGDLCVENAGVWIHYERMADSGFTPPST